MSQSSSRYFGKIKGQKEALPIDVQAHGNGKYTVSLNGEKHELDALTLAHGALSLLVDGQSYSVELEPHDPEVAVLINGHVSYVDVADERALRLRAAAEGFAVEGAQVIVAPMPGKIIKVLVALGDTVQEGQGLVVIEAMKMENELKSAKAGTVLELLAKEGATVENGAKLVVVG